MASYVCQICHKPLTNQKSIKIGMGPVCATKEQIQGHLFETREGAQHKVRGVFTGDIELSREVDGTPVVNIPQIKILHSPTGFEWGYGGSGPADFALNILLQFTESVVAELLHQQFKWEFIAGIPEEGCVLKGEVIQSWIDEKLKEMEKSA